MPDLYGPFDGATSPFAQAQWYRDRGPLEPSGVYGTPAATPAAGELGLTTAGMAVTLGLGRAHVRGAAYERTGTAWTGSSANNTSGNPRIDRLVLRRDLNLKTVVPVIVQGTPAAAPALPALTQVEDGAFDLPLFHWTVAAGATAVSNVVDDRAWLDYYGGTSRLPITPAAGWSAPNTARPPRLGIDYRARRVFAEGIVSNLNLFTPNGTQVVFTVPVGYRPAGVSFHGAMVSTAQIGGLDVDPPTGNVVASRTVPGGASVAANALWSLDDMWWPLPDIP